MQNQKCSVHFAVTVHQNFQILTAAPTLFRLSFQRRKKKHKGMESGSGSEVTRLWRVYRTAHQMVHDRVCSETYNLRTARY